MFRSTSSKSYLVRPRNLTSVELCASHKGKGTIAIRQPVQRGRLTLSAKAHATFAGAVDALVANGTLVPLPGV